MLCIHCENQARDDTRDDDDTMIAVLGVANKLDKTGDGISVTPDKQREREFPELQLFWS